MPIQSRCPSCAAAVPSNAAWCSLCHADLRARKEPPRVSRPVDDVLPSAGRASAPSARAQVADPEPEPVGRREAGRHARTPEPVGRREAGRRAASRPSTRTLDPELLADLELADGQVAPEQIDQVADRMLARLAVTERAPRMFDPEDVPGGKWTVAGVGAFVMILALLSVFALLGAIFGR